MNNVMVLRHVPHESVGTLEHHLRGHGLDIDFVDCWDAHSLEGARARFDSRRIAGLVVMGGPMNVDETARYPFLALEVEWLTAAIDTRLPTLGVCLGSQLLAKALGARVYPHRVKEIGWCEIELTPAAGDDGLFRGSQARETVFQWHGDTFDLPRGAVQLARSAACQQQAFRFGPSAYGLQFHVEMTAEMVDDWLDEPSMCAEVAALDYINPHHIRQGAAAGLERMAPVAERLLGRFAALCHATSTAIA
jgi:GMP synthase (glutamine-hydrolysing)